VAFHRVHVSAPRQTLDLIDPDFQLTSFLARDQRGAYPSRPSSGASEIRATITATPASTL
jgi:hypothetical protein